MAEYGASRRKSTRNGPFWGMELLRLLAQKARNTWRSLTSMGTALVLLFLLALGAIPGALLPQRSLNAGKVDDYLTSPPGDRPLAERAAGLRRVLQLLVHRHLRAAVRLPRRLPHPADDRARPQPARHPGGRAAQPGPAAQARRRLAPPASPTTWPPPSPAGCAAGARLTRHRRSSTVEVVRREGLSARIRQPASSTSRCWACWSRWPSASCSATRAT